MIKKTLIGLGLLVATTLSGCVVAVPRPGVVYGPVYAEGYDDAVVVAPVPTPFFGYWGWGWYGHGYGRGGYYHGRGHWR
jgi:hypothetical protein